MNSTDSIANFIAKIPHKGLWLAVIILSLLHLLILPFSPPGFFLDEAATGAHVVSMVQHMTNAHNQAWPLFSASLGGGYTTPVYLYPLTLWASVFGYSELSLRYFSQFVTLLAIDVMAFALRLWLGNKWALVSAVVGLAMPWGWLQGSLAWDPVMVPLLAAISFLSVSALLFSPSHKARLTALISLPISLIALAYVYPPCRVSAPLLFMAFYIILFLKKKISLLAIILSCVGAAIIAMPLLFFMLRPEAITRSSELSIFHDATLLEGIGRLFVNLFLLINPIFLFITGDPNLRHATGIQGMLGLAALAAVNALLVGLYGFIKSKVPLRQVLSSKTRLLAVLAIAGVVAGLLGSALTNEGQPHSLRATLVGPFTVILLTLGWSMIIAKRKFIRQLAIGLFIVGTVGYAIDLAFYYPTRAAASFDTSVREQIYDGNSPTNYPNLSRQYYQMK